ncbi:tetratricopeptide repeat protein [Microbacterium sp. APC 3898]|uniref:Tetratricopeptide repeat protein n=1 Tax=Planococcus notacanthi TaxID=3035188 RepID=A0ABT7ZII9_9BACL|nr:MULTISPECIES: tetratricopeptide repeat protein [Terrabacteria group]MDN3426963.1 tetratricopeptide repeat protein [Planococcus sp. APC 4016]MDN3499889.1 tetratricopeptide repeat protein [Microbacterium sp. APC 3898]
MRKKYRDLKRKGNVIVFPTTVTRLLSEGMTYLKEEKYEDARDSLYQVLSYEPEHAAALGGYAYCLYELGEFQEALEVCRELLKIGPIHYLETMELYISILMQVREFEEAEKMIEALIEEKVLPEERLEQFQQLRDLNERIASNAASEKVDASKYAIDTFLALHPAEQEQLILDLPTTSYQALKKKLIAIIEHPEADLLTKTYILFMLFQEKIDAEVSVRKFHYQGTFSINELPDPVNNSRIRKITAIIDNELAKDPTRLEMVKELFERHIYLLYPFIWDDYNEEDVAQGYMDYTEGLFSGMTSFSEDEKLLELIQQAELWFEMRNG